MMTLWNDPEGGFHPASAPDFLPRRELEELQLGRLRSVVRRAYERCRSSGSGWMPAASPPRRSAD